MDDAGFMKEAISQASKSKAADGYKVGAVLVSGNRILSKAFSGESIRYTHAEEYAIKKYGRDLSGAIIYSTMEPCDKRRSGKKSCCDLIMVNKIRRVVFGTFDPDARMVCNGIEALKNAGMEMLQLKELEEECRRLTPDLF